MQFIVITWMLTDRVHAIALALSLMSSFCFAAQATVVLKLLCACHQIIRHSYLKSSFSFHAIYEDLTRFHAIKY